MTGAVVGAFLGPPGFAVGLVAAGTAGGLRGHWRAPSPDAPRSRDT